jgi:hypothetical protein
MAQPRSRVPLAIGLTAAAGVGYYLFQSGGNPKVAEKKFEGKLLPLTTHPSCTLTQR